MQTPARITFHHLPASASLEADVQRGVAELERICDRLTACRVVITAPEGARRHGRPFEVKIEVDLPGHAIVAGSAAERTDHEDAHLAVRDAFHSARRQLEDYLGRRRDRQYQEPAATE